MSLTKAKATKRVEVSTVRGTYSETGDDDMVL